MNRPTYTRDVDKAYQALREVIGTFGLSQAQQVMVWAAADTLVRAKVRKQLHERSLPVAEEAG